MGRRWWSGPPTLSQSRPVTSWVSQGIPFHLSGSYPSTLGTSSNSGSGLGLRSGSHFPLADLPNVSQCKSFPPWVTFCPDKAFLLSDWTGSVPPPSRRSRRTWWDTMVSTFENYVGTWLRSPLSSCCCLMPSPRCCVFHMPLGSFSHLLLGNHLLCASFGLRS